MNFRKIKLAEVDVVDNQGAKELRKVNEEEVGLILSNRALRYGYKEGLIKTTSISKLIDSLPEDIELGWTILYLGAIGANPGFEKKLTREDFIDRLDISPEEVTYTAQSTIMGELPDTYEEFIDELKKKTQKDSEDKKK